MSPTLKFRSYKCPTIFQKTTYRSSAEASLVAKCNSGNLNQFSPENTSCKVCVAISDWSHSLIKEKGNKLLRIEHGIRSNDYTGYGPQWTRQIFCCSLVRVKLKGRTFFQFNPFTPQFHPIEATTKTLGSLLWPVYPPGKYDSDRTP